MWSVLVIWNHRTSSFGLRYVQPKPDQFVVGLGQFSCSRFGLFYQFRKSLFLHGPQDLTVFLFHLGQNRGDKLLVTTDMVIVSCRCQVTPFQEKKKGWLLQKFFYLELLETNHRIGASLKETLALFTWIVWWCSTWSHDWCTLFQKLWYHLPKILWRPLQNTLIWISNH